MPARVEHLRKVKASTMMEKVASLDGVLLVMIIESQAVAHKVTSALTIIPGKSQADVQSAARPVILPHSAIVQSNQRLRMLNGKSLRGSTRMKSAMTNNGSQRSMRHPRARKEKEKDLSLKGSPRERMHRDRLPRGHRSLHSLKETVPTQAQA